MYEHGFVSPKTADGIYLTDGIHVFWQECVLQCEGHLSTGGSWGACQDFLQTTESTPEAGQASTETYSLPQQHQEEKKYGGFMKRYGGFMKRYGGFMKRYGGFMKKAAVPQPRHHFHPGLRHRLTQHRHVQP